MTANLKDSEKAFFDENPGKRWSTLDYCACEISHGITFKARPSDLIEEATYRAVNDLRNVLDQTTYAASKALSSGRLKYTKFPFGECRKDFARRLSSTKGSYRDIPAALHPKLASFEPYWSKKNPGQGNDLLRAFAEMANPNKHHVPLGVEAQTGMRVYSTRGFVTMFGTKWDWSGKTELYRTIPGKPYEIDMELEPRIAFGEIGLLRGKPALRTLSEISTVVESILLGIEAETARLLEGGLIHHTPAGYGKYNIA